METIYLLYKELFSLRFNHTAYLTTTGSRLLDVLKISMDDRTSRQLLNYQIEFRTTVDQLVCLIRSLKVNPPGYVPLKPYISIASLDHLRFYLSAPTEFFTSTYIASVAPGQVYHFTNKVDHVDSGNLLLSKNMAVYDSSQSYPMGSVVSSSGDIYATLKDVKAADSIALNNSAYWKKLTASLPVISNADLEDAAGVSPEQPCFAVIDIYLSGLGNASYNLVDGSQQLQSPVYTLNFKSKS